MKEIKILHLFPKLLSLYGEYGNVAVLRRALADAGWTVTVDRYETGALDLDGYAFIYIGAVTEDNLLEAVKRLMIYKDAVRSSVEKGQLWRATGNAMTLFGRSVTRCETVTEALGCFPYITTIHDSKRYLGDVLTAEGFGGEFVGFINTSSVYEGITAPLLQLRLGGKLGNTKRDGADGIQEKNFYGTELIGPVLVKNPHFLQYICRELTGEEITLPADSNAQKAYDVALAELKKRVE